jgi:hypothetical protein
MNTYYATTDQSTTIQGNVITANCSCGESYAILVDDNTKVVVCNDCYENSSNREKYI